MSLIECIDDYTSDEDIQSAYEKLSKEEAQVMEQLEWTIGNRHNLEARLSQLTHLVPTLQLVKADAKKLENTINFTHDLANAVSAKVRQLDLAKSRVCEVQMRVGDLLDLEGCAAGVSTALLQEDYERAAAHIHRFLSMDESILRHSADTVNKGENVESWFKRLTAADVELHGIVVRSFDESVKKNDSASIERFFKIFPLINRQEEGLNKFAMHLCSKIKEQSVVNVDKAKTIAPKDKRAHVVWADTVTLLFEDIARTIEIHQPIIETYYKPGNLCHVLSLIQDECDKQIQEMVSGMKKHRNIDSLTRSVTDSLRNSGNNFAAGSQSLPSPSANVNSALDPRALDTLLGELTLMNARAELYLRFLKRRVTGDLDSSMELESVRRSKLIAFESQLSRSQLTCDMAVLIGDYTILEQFYLNESFKKAIAMDSMEPQALTSSLLDDAFYIIKKSVRRAIASSSVDGVCAVLNHSVDLLERQLFPNFQGIIRKGFPVQGYLDLTQAYSALQSLQGVKTNALPPSDSDALRQAFLTALNNAETSVRHIESLHSGLKETIASAMRDRTKTDNAKLDSCLSDLLATGRRFASVTDFGLGQLQATAIKPKVKLWVDSFTAVSHDITEEELSLYDANDPFSHELMMQMDALIGSFVALLTTGNHKSFVELIVKELANQMEKAVMKSAFNRLGGLQFDRDVRSITAYLSQVSEWGVREHLSRIQQIATLINLENLREVQEYSSGPTWRLTPSDMKKVLRLRVDFKYEEIQKLRL